MSNRSKTIPLRSLFAIKTVRQVVARAAAATRRSFVAPLLAGVVGLASASQAVGQQVCSPALTVKDVKFSQWRLPAMERQWSAVVSVDASRCAPNSVGNFEIGFERLIENGVDIDFFEKFEWTSPSVKIALVFWANEAVGRHWMHKVSACPCAR